MLGIRRGYLAALMTLAKTKDTRNRYTRYSSTDEEANDFQMPDIEGAEYIVELLHEVGPVGSNGYGVEGLKWTEIQSWLALTGLFMSLGNPLN